MPNSYKHLHEEGGLWPAWELPTEATYKLLAHLAAAGEPRLYVWRNSHQRIYKTEASNSLSVPGWKVRGDASELLRGAQSGGNKPWVEPDPEVRPNPNGELTVYRISDAGLEVIAQYYARIRFNKESVALAKEIIRECRKAVGAPAK